MTLSPGVRLGAYEILAPIGAGGMGEVYRATDTRLNRTVAIKMIAPHIAHDPDFRTRFRREAEAIAALSHPHICVLHDVGEYDGHDFLVMEHVEGEPLASRLARGAMPLDQVLRTATEIADALDKAHRRGIVHRDLKPANVMLTKAGSKLLDFGLARLRPAIAGGPGFTAAATQSTPLTSQGAILGTLQYMAPEQLEGLDADARSDIFALGAVVYEMATGKRAFDGQSPASVIAAILGSQPAPIARLQPLAPPALDRVVSGCLAKDPEDRWQDARDIVRELRWIAEGSDDRAAARTADRPRRRLPRVAAWLGAAALIAGVAAALLREPPASPVPTMRLALPLGRPLLTAVDMPAAAISPDGSHVAFVSEVAGTPQLFVRSMSQPQATPLAGTEGGLGPFFSPDGGWIGFFADRQLKKVPVTGGTPIVLAEAPTPRGAAWGAEAIYFTPYYDGGIVRIPAAGGTPETISTPDRSKGENSHRWPELLPGDRTLLYVVRSGGSFEDAQIVAQSLASGERTTVVKGGTFPRWSSSGHLLFARGAGVFAAAFDEGRRTLIGAPAPVIDGVYFLSNSGNAQYAVSATGTLIYAPAQGREGTIVWIDRRGTQRLALPDRRAYGGITLSPDARRAAVVVNRGDDAEIWMAELDRGTLSRLTFGHRDQSVVWSPDGAQLAFSSNRAGANNIFLMAADGRGGPVQISKSANWQFPSSWTPDGKALLFYEFSPKTNHDVWILPLSSDRKPRVLIETPFNDGNAVVSPDGRLVAYASDESGRSEVYVSLLEGTGGRQQVSTGGGVLPLWSRDGRELFFWEGNRLMAVSIGGAGAADIGAPRAVFQAALFQTQGATGYSVAPDGERFLMIPSEAESRPTQMNLVLNWADELSRRAPFR